MSQLDAVVVTSPTEQRNPRTLDIDRVPTLEVLRLLNAEDRLLPDAVAAVLPAVAEVVDEAARRLAAGGRMHYFGAGTSGRIGVMDAAELLPTFNLAPDVVVAHHAGGAAALTRPIEGAEDQADLGAREAGDVGPGDVVIGLTASGRTPYVAGALRQARAVGAFSVLISANPQAALAAEADVHVGVDTGPEAVAGSTRLKAATAQKLVLNSLSTALMIAQGRTYSNLMIEVAASNRKLRGRLVTILGEATGLPAEDCVAALEAADGELKTALVSVLAGVTAGEARDLLVGAGGRVRNALSSARG